MKYFVLIVSILLIACQSDDKHSKTLALDSVALSHRITQLEESVYLHNNAFKYDSSFLILKHFLNQKNRTPTEFYYGNLFLSYTYKRLFDYSTVLSTLDSALSYGLQTSNPAYYRANIACQKSFVYFDTHKYDLADSVMKTIAARNYANLNDEQIGKIKMQEAYLKFQKKDYTNAEKIYQEALDELQKGSPCDLPMIYAKLIELYGATANEKKMQENFQKSVVSADCCHIFKYKLYTYEMLYQTYEKNGNLKKAYSSFKIYDSLNTVYNQKGYLSDLRKYELKLINEKDKFNNLTNTSQRHLIYLLMSAILILFLLILSYSLWKRKKEINKEYENRMNFTKQLLENTEDEKKRIASDLHDSISHELLALKSPFSQGFSSFNIKIDNIINEVRIISRNLHPVMFDRIGLQASIDQLIEGTQNQYNFMINSEFKYTGCLSTACELQIFRIIQEALTNIIKYAEAHAAKISVFETPSKVVLIEIKDNGKGFLVQETLNSKKAFGLHNIIERSRVIGGVASIRSSSEGTIINIVIPSKLA